MKVCNRCNEVKSFDDFHRNPLMKDGHLNQCRSCRNAWVSSYRKKKASEWGWEEASKKLRGSTPESVRKRWSRRRRREKSQRCDCCRDRDIKRIREFAVLVGMEIDHIVPLGKGGSHCEKNIQILPRDLNRAKSDKISFLPRTVV